MGRDKKRPRGAIMSDPAALERRHVFFSGRVQGVGFRATCASLSRGFDLTGWVRNLDDGRVELQAQGPPTEIERYLAAIAAHFAGYIRDTQVTTINTVPAEPAGVMIRH